jgi:hypothetical protein
VVLHERYPLYDCIGGWDVLTVMVVRSLEVTQQLGFETLPVFAANMLSFAAAFERSAQLPICGALEAFTIASAAS